MTTFLDVRALAGSGGVSDKVQIKTGTTIHNYTDLSPSDLLTFIHGQHVLIGTHGFNVNRSDGIQHLSFWEGLLQLPPSSVFIGLLWPGDSESFHALSYPVEPKLAMDSGNMLAAFLDSNFQNAASVSLVSHSLGARVVLQTASQMHLPIRRLILMAGAIGDDCLTAEYAAVVAKVEMISVLASMEDEVLRWAFPIGDFASDFFDHNHPWFESAVGRSGPRKRPDHYQSPCEIPDCWNYGHGNYLQVDPQAPPILAPPTDVPQNGAKPLGGAPGWQEAFSASFVSTRFR
jgi:pimeloyl-ACP methyl ester carboxylesterase